MYTWPNAVEDTSTWPSAVEVFDTQSANVVISTFGEF